MKAPVQDPKSETQRIQSPKEFRGLKPEAGPGRRWRDSVFGPWNSFGFRNSTFGLLAATAVLAGAFTAPAQNLSLDWFTLDGGGGTSTDGVFAVSGTIGQPDAGAQPLTGGNYSLTGGFWSLFAVPTRGVPLLTIRLASANAATVSWPSPSAGFALQQNADLTTMNWLAAPQPVTDNGTNKFILVSPPAGSRFYRLFKP